MEYEVRSSEGWDEARFTIEDTGTGLTMSGPMAIYGSPSRLMSDIDLAGNTRARAELERLGAGRRFREVIEPGAFRRSLNAAPDIILHYQHDENTLPLGRTKAGTLRLSEQGGEVRAEADLPDNEWGRPVRDAIKRGDIGGISFRMGKVTESWGREKLSDGYDGPVRRLHEIQLRREVSLVTFPGYDTPAMVRALAEAVEAEESELEAIFAKLSAEGTKITVPERDLVMAAINARTEAPVADAAALISLASKREALAALAG